MNGLPGSVALLRLDTWLGLGYSTLILGLITGFRKQPNSPFLSNTISFFIGPENAYRAHNFLYYFNRAFPYDGGDGTQLYLGSARPSLFAGRLINRG